jgi:hypothetical protein
VTFTGIAFQHCANPQGDGGALSAVGSSITVSQCSFMNCSASNGGAVSLSGDSSNSFLHVHNSSFSHNWAIASALECARSRLPDAPCSTWGGAIAAFEVYDVRISLCNLTENVAVGNVPLKSPQYSKSKNAVAGGGCVSVLFRGNSSGAAFSAVNNTFSRCKVQLSSSKNVLVGNGTLRPAYLLSSAIL